MRASVWMWVLEIQMRLNRRIKMDKMIVKYDKNFRMKIENNRNSEIILTDRNGEMLSPSELLAASVASCAMTVLSIKLEANNTKF